MRTPCAVWFAGARGGGAQLASCRVLSVCCVCVARRRRKPPRTREEAGPIAEGLMDAMSKSVTNKIHPLGGDGDGAPPSACPHPLAPGFSLTTRKQHHMSRSTSTSLPTPLCRCCAAAQATTTTTLTTP